MGEGRARECEWNAFLFYFSFLFERLLRRLFSSWKEFLLRSLHIIVRPCKLGSNVQSAPKTSVLSLPEQGPVVRNADNAIDFPKRIPWIAIYPVDSAIQRLNNRNQISAILAKSPGNTYARPIPPGCWDVTAKLRGYNNIAKERGNEKQQNFPKRLKVFIWDCRYPVPFKFATKTIKHWLQVLPISKARADLVSGDSK